MSSLYIWQKVDSALSLDPSSLAALLYLQLHCSGKYSLVHCASPDHSPSGQLPCLTYGMHTASGLLAIIKVADQLGGISSGNALLTAQERAQSVARTAQVEAALGDLVAYTYFAVGPNFHRATQPALASVLPVPQRYYVPARLRKTHQPRLEAAGIWHIHDQHLQDDRASPFEKLARKKDAKEKKENAKRVFEKEQVLSKASAIFSTCSSSLGNRPVFYGSHDNPSTFDLVFAAHIHLLSQELPDPSIAHLLKEAYPNLIAHSESLFTLAFPDAASLPPLASSNLTRNILSLLPRWSFSSSSRPREETTDTNTDEEARFARWRWAFYGGAFVVTTSYIWMLGLVPIYLQALARLAEANREEVERDEDEDDEEDDDEE
ncbi:hypothetical protein BXZ70DRAFT_1003899 [Cristinia sonorae]|uniref:Mitochondrial outer membrane transport complex Sam37/metaxin N-terminal domain-containing protein n=1 Tax=Cristinia sonorae TaxID=1940300 RepID=A0A8K0UXD2_9AGAR|nr:hypothetical protein BXZ70DRAFT_1003899 [Cristinia sonorae]